MINNNLYISTGAFKENNLSNILKECETTDFHCLELSSGIQFSNLLRNKCKQLSGEMSFLIHNYFPGPVKPFVLNLASTDPLTLKLSRDHCQNAIDLCVDLGAPFYSVHSGFAMNLKPEQLGQPDEQSRISAKNVINPKLAYNIFLESIYQINCYAEEKSIGILIENNVVTSKHVERGKKDTFLMVKSDEIICLMKDVASPNLGLLVDVGHLNVLANALGYDRGNFLEDVKSHIRAFHLSENDGITDQNMSVRKDSWFLPHLKEFPNAVVVLEVYNLSPEEIKDQLKLLLINMSC